MEIVIEKGTLKDIEECITEIMDSELGRKAFKKPDVARGVVENGIKAGEVYIARSPAPENNFLGIVRSAPKGMFNSFPYLHLIAVAKDMRGKGVGNKLLDYFENINFQNTDKLFLLVSDFNTRAKKLYESKGYQEVGFIDNMFNEGIGEYIMMKQRSEK